MSEPPSYLFSLMFTDGDAIASTGVAMLVLKVGVVLLLVAANGFFVAAEFAFVGVRRCRIETLAEAGKASAIRLLRLLNNLNAYLSASQLGITLASLTLGWVGEPVIARMLERPFSGLSDPVRHGLAFGIAFSIITSLHIVLGEQAPKLLGLARAERELLWQSPSLWNSFIESFNGPSACWTGQCADGSPRGPALNDYRRSRAETRRSGEAQRRGVSS